MYKDGNLPWRFAWGDYVALSYCWGDARITREIIVNGCSFHVIVNLETALRQLRDSHCIKQGFKLWADAICIDQRNLEERGQQIGRMRCIYSLVWYNRVPVYHHQPYSFVARRGKVRFERIG